MGQPKTINRLDVETVFTACTSLGDLNTVSRVKVPGGWIYDACTVTTHGAVARCTTFVPDPKHEWELK